MVSTKLIISVICALALASSVSAYTTSGNKILDPNGKQVIIRGVDRPSFEWNSNGENANQNDYKLMQQWGSNCVRIALNQDFWLPGASTYASSYQNTIDQQVQWAKAAGMGVILDLHWSDKGNWGNHGDQQLMADINSIAFWTQVATKYKSDPWVIFELYNEPHDVSPSVWRDGGSAGGFTVAGMQQLYNAVRLTGATNLVIVNGLDWAFDLASVYPSQKITGTNIAYGTHPYDFPGKQQGDWPSKFGFVAKDYPVIMTEFGQYCATNTYVRDLLAYAEANGIHWTAWAWYTGGCGFPSIISDWNGTPTDIGVMVKALMKGGSSIPSTSSSSTSGTQSTPKPPSQGATGAPVTVTPAAGAQVLFDDTLQNGWQSWSWAPVSFSVSNPVAYGSASISMTLNSYGGLYFHKDGGFVIGQYATLSFAANGGDISNPDISIRLYDASATALPMTLSMPSTISAGKWSTQSVSLAGFGLSSSTVITGIAIVYNGGDNSGKNVYFDAVQLLPAQSTTPAPSTPAPSTPAPATPKPATNAPATSSPATPKPATNAPSTPKPATNAPATNAPATPSPSTPAPSTPAPSTPAPSTPAPSTGKADCSSVCDASCINIQQTLATSWGNPTIYQYSVSIQNKCTTKALTSLTLAAGSWTPFGFWNAQATGNNLVINLQYNPIPAGGSNTNFGYQNMNGQAVLSVGSYSFQ